MSAKVCSNRIENNKWTVTTAKRRRKVFSTKNLTEANNTFSLSIANRYEQLINLQDTLENDTTLMTQGENNTSGILNCDHQTKLQHQRRERIHRIDNKNKEDFQMYHSPTLLNGKIENKSMKTVSSEVRYKNSGIKKKFTQHKVTLIGDSFLRGIWENVELSLSCIYSMLKPGCKLNTLL
jgi:hypothetical protein